MKNNIFLFLFIGLLSACSNDDSTTKTSNKSYKDATLNSDERVELLLQEMTIEEKVAQLQCIWNEKKRIFDSNNWFSIDSARSFIPHGIGQIGRPSEGRTPEENAKLTNDIQKYFMEETRLGIPVVFHEECLHGHAASNKTSFSQPIGLASTWNTELVEQLYTMTAKEARVVGTHQALTPVVDVSREPRWGRVEETFGEDPYLVSQMGLAAVRGFQGRDEQVKGDHIMATLKHFAAHGQPESGTNVGPVQVSERTLRETFLYPFEVCVKDGNVKSIMASYNEIDGVPSHVNSWLLGDVLRDEWAFSGTVVSDYYAVEELEKRHHVAESFEEAGIKSLMSGVDVELPEPVCFPPLIEAVKQGKIEERYVDRAVRRVLKQKFELGLFENPYVDVARVTKNVDTEEHHAIALQAAEETMVLLKNHNSILPLDKVANKKIAIIGPNADRTLLGGYSGTPSYFVTVLEGMKKQFGEQNILYSLGCQITEDSVVHNGEKTAAAWHLDPVVKVSKAENQKHIKRAVNIAKQADIVVLCLGGNELTSREAWAESHMGDRTDLQLVGEQMELVNAINATGKPLVSLLFNGKPLAVTDLTEKTDALIECWYLGSECGNAVANVLSGEVSPSGKLPISIPRSVGHIPCFYNYKPTARRGYLFDDVSPLFPFGYGLSYTSFEYSDIQLSADSVQAGDEFTATINVSNTGDFKGKETIQLYVRDKVSSVTRPVKELKQFNKETFEPGESKTITFTITDKDLAFWTINKEYAVEAGEFELMIGGTSSDDGLKKATFIVK